jgi:acetyl esterase/lipase
VVTFLFWAIGYVCGICPAGAIERRDAKDSAVRRLAGKPMTSLRAKLLLAILRLVNARKAFTDGENFLADALEKQKNGPALPGRRLRRKFLIRDKQIAGVRSFIVQPRENASAHRILYLHGGAYAWDLISLHWTIIEDLIALTGASVTVPIYPLTPTTGWEAAHDAVRRVYGHLVDKSAAGTITIMGDSAGGGLALAVTMALRDDARPMPGSLVLFSPWLDVTLSDPEQRALAPRDPILAPPGLLAAGRAYANGVSPQDSRVSPLFGSFDGLPPVAILSGTRDLLNSDARRVARRAPGVVQMFEYPDMPHVWVGLPIPEAHQALQQAANFVKLNTVTSHRLYSAASE